nr:pistil-specific extensin-like protein [Ipomoea batatas]
MVARNSQSYGYNRDSKNSSTGFNGHNNKAEEVQEELPSICVDLELDSVQDMMVAWKTLFHPEIQTVSVSLSISAVPKKKPIAVRGLVYCKYCKYRGIDNLYKSTPIKGAVVKLACSNTKYHLSETTTTDKNGFFLFYMPKIVSSAGYRKCKVYLVKSPLTQCSVKTNYKLGKAGAPLIPTPLKKSAPYNLYTVGPFAFEPSKKVPCPR